MTILRRSSDESATTVAHLVRAAMLVALLLGVVSVPTPAGAAEPWDRVLDITFPTAPGSRYSNDYTAARGGGTRMHCGTDIFGAKHQPVYAARGGKITFMPTTKPSYGYIIYIAGDDGRRYSYIHMNDDTPGTQDDAAGPEHAYAPGLRVGSVVARGQLIGYMGDSGNAKGGTDHLHFEIHDPSIDNPSCTNGSGAHRANPYYSLQAAAARGDYGGRPAAPPARGIDRACPLGVVAAGAFPDVGGTHAAAIDCVGWWQIAAGNTTGHYLPHQGISREQLATFVVRLFDAVNKPLPAAPTNAFGDDDGSAHEEAIDRLAGAGIVNGTAPGRFDPGAKVSRAQMATVLTRTYELAAGTALPAGDDTFVDDNGNTHEAAIDRLAAARITVGADGISYEPLRPVSRAEMATFLSRTLDLLVEQGAASPPR